MEGGGGWVAPVTDGLRSTVVSKLTDVPKRILIGRALRSDRLGETLLPKRVALPVFASDPLSSVAYAPGEVLLVLSIAGLSAYHFSPWIAVAVVVLLFTVVASYRQNVRAYPSGGGDYEVAGTNLGPKAGEMNHFRRYAPEPLPYAIERFSNEMNRLYGVMNTRLKGRRYLAGGYSIADMACVGWIRHAERQGETFEGFPHLRRWLAAVKARPAVQRGLHVRVEEAGRVDINDPKVRAVLFGQRARA